MRNYFQLLFALLAFPYTSYSQMFGGQLLASEPINIASLNCNLATNNGVLIAGIAATGVNSIVSYTDGDGSLHNGQTVSSSGVAGLTATLLPGNFATGPGTLTYTITGTPASSGSAYFSLSIGGQSCILSRIVNFNGISGITDHSCGAANVHNAAISYGSMTDQDGNVYKTCIINNREWMAENLKVSHYRNGDLIPVETSNAGWVNTTSGICSWYNNDSITNHCPYGKLYNWHAVADSRNLCPSGWHVPTDSEYVALINYLDPNANGGIQQNNAGGPLKSTGTQYWTAPNADAVNSTGFSGLPGGCRNIDLNGLFNFINGGGYWWSSTPAGSGGAQHILLNLNNGTAARSFTYRRQGDSVRCIRD
jgi:uncharacterized protein (TIGR02145 family)